MVEISKKTQESRSSDFDTRYWISILVAILIGANIVAITAYYLSQPDPHLPTIVWNYLKSEQFKVITVTIFLPIIILLLEYFFEVRKTHQEKIDDLVKIQNERIQKKDEEDEALRWEVINNTEIAFNELWSLGEELIWLDIDSFKDQNDEKCSKNQYIGDYIKRLSQCINSWSKVVNDWRHLFRENLDEINPKIRFSEQITKLLNVWINCLETVAINLGHAENHKQIIQAKNLQYNLLPIIGGFKNIFYRQMMNSLKDSMTIKFSSKEDKDNKGRTLKQRISDNLISLKENNDILINEANDFCMLFSQMKNIKDKKVLKNKYKIAVDANEESFQEKLDDLINELKIANRKDHEDLMHSFEISCPFEWIEHLAFWFVKEKTTSYIHYIREEKKV